MFRTSLKSLTLSILLVFSFTAFAAPSINTLLRNAADPVVGNPMGKVTVVEFFDFECSHCINNASVVENAIQANPNVRFVFKNVAIFGPTAEYAARAALAAHRQGKYYQMTHALFASNAPLNKANILKIATNIGLNISQFQKDMDSPAVKNQIRANYSLAKALNLGGTPSFFIGPTNATNMKQLKYVLGEISSSELQTAINQASK